MAKAVKKKADPVKVDPIDNTGLIAELKDILVKLDKAVEGPGTVADRQAIADKLRRIVAEFSS